MATYLVTGGAGFIGSNIVGQLVERGERVKVLDNFSTGNKRNIEAYRGDIELIEGDFTDYGTAKRAVKDIDIIFHQGAIPSVPRSIQNPLQTNYANIDGTLHLLHAAVEHKASRFIYASSSSAYGFNEQLPKREDMPGKPMSPYAVSKYAGEHYCKVFHAVYGIETVSLRYFNVFGPRQTPQSKYAAVIPTFIEAMLNDQSPVIYGDGRQSRDFTYIENAVSANLLAAAAPKLQGETINVGSGGRIALNDLIEEINDILGKNLKPVYTTARRGDVRHSLADIGLAGQLIGYRPIVPFREGLKRTVDWLKSRQT